MQSKSFERQFSSHPEPIALDFTNWPKENIFLVSTFVPVLFSATMGFRPARPGHKYHQNKGLVCEAAYAGSEEEIFSLLALEWNFLTIDTLLHILPLFFRSNSLAKLKLT